MGQPNHKTVSTVGPSCTMNSLGRHYRDPSNPENPSCNYTVNGAQCTFFTDGHEFSQLPYPDDISMGPMSTEPAQSASDISQVLALLNQQRQDQQQQAEQMRVLQEQVASILQRDAAVSGHPGSIPRSTVVTTTLTDCTTTSTFSVVSIPVSLAPSRMVPSPQAYNSIPSSAPNPPVPQQVPAPQQVSVSQQASVPQPITAAASNLAATLQASLGNGSGIYSNLTMDHLD